MKIHDIIRRIQNRFQHKEAPIPDELIRELILSLEEEDREESCSCEDVFAALDQYTELEMRGEDAARLMPLLRKHMDRCHNCGEEHQALLEILQRTQASLK